MYYYTVKNGVVTNKIVSSAEFAVAQVISGVYDAVIDDSSVSSSPDIGWTYSGGTFTAPAFQGTTPSVLAGTTGGSVSWTQTRNDNGSYRFMASFSTYQNSSATNQTISFPMTFVSTPLITGNNTGVALSASKTTLTIISPMNSTAFSGNVVVEGF